jgi:hypothetical protein
MEILCLNDFATAISSGEKFVVCECKRDEIPFCIKHTRDFNYHLISLGFHTTTFGSVVWERRELHAAIPTSYNIVGVIPRIPQFKLTLFDVINKFENTPYDDALHADDLACIQAMPNGWKLSALRRYWPVELPTLPDGWPDFQRPYYYTGLPNTWNDTNTVLIHPLLDRPLNDCELEVIARQQGELGLTVWLDSLVASMTPCERITSGYTSHCLPMPTEEIPRKERAPRLFNIGENGQPIFPWQEIKRHHLEWRRANNLTGPFGGAIWLSPESEFHSYAVADAQIDPLGNLPTKQPIIGVDGDIHTGVTA